MGESNFWRKISFKKKSLLLVLLIYTIIILGTVFVGPEWITEFYEEQVFRYGEIGIGLIVLGNIVYVVVRFVADAVRRKLYEKEDNIAESIFEEATRWLSLAIACALFADAGLRIVFLVIVEIKWDMVIATIIVAMGAITLVAAHKALGHLVFQQGRNFKISLDERILYIFLAINVIILTGLSVIIALLGKQ